MIAFMGIALAVILVFGGESQVLCKPAIGTK